MPWKAVLQEVGVGVGAFLDGEGGFAWEVAVESAREMMVMLNLVVVVVARRALRISEPMVPLAFADR